MRRLPRSLIVRDSSGSRDAGFTPVGFTNVVVEGDFWRERFHLTLDVTFVSFLASCTVCLLTV